MSRFTYIILFLVSALISCSRTERKMPQEEVISTAAANKDSQPEKIESYHRQVYYSQAFICASNSSVFSDSTLQIPSVKPKIGDSLEVIEAVASKIEGDGGFGYFSPNIIYKVKSLNGDSSIKGFISGKYIGIGSKVILLDSSVAFLLCHYSAVNFADDDIQENPGEILLVQNSKILGKLPFKGYSELSAGQITKKNLKPAISLFSVEYGYPACGYTHGEILLSWDGKNFRQILKTYSMGDSGIYANWSDWIFPDDSLGEKDHLVVRDYTFEVDEKGNDDEADNDTSLILTGQRKYLYSNYTFTQIFSDTVEQVIK